MHDRRGHGIVYRRGGAACIFEPASSRLEGDLHDEIYGQDTDYIQRLANATDKWEAAVAAQPYEKLTLLSNVRTLAYTIGDETSINE
jgi:hypothetical protein